MKIPTSRGRPTYDEGTSLIVKSAVLISDCFVCVIAFLFLVFFAALRGGRQSSPEGAARGRNGKRSSCVVMVLDVQHRQRPLTTIGHRLACFTATACALCALLRHLACSMSVWPLRWLVHVPLAPEDECSRAHQLERFDAFGGATTAHGVHFSACAASSRTAT